MEYEQLLQSELGELEIIREELQNKEYRGMIVKTAKDGTMTRTRLAKKTDKKAGYFVAFWEKDELIYWTMGWLYYWLDILVLLDCDRYCRNYSSWHVRKILGARLTAMDSSTCMCFDTSIV